jgi:hypothetical protein
MTLLIVCNSIEPGRDGVGDYARKLALESQKFGHEVFLVGLNDKHTNSIIELSRDISKDFCGGLRIPAGFPWKQKMRILIEFIETNKPGFISLQYGPFGFNSKGLPFTFAFFSGKLRKYKIHLMFHETWVGITSRSPLKHKILGFFQQFVTKYFVGRLHPGVITTSNRLYQIVLQQGGIKSAILPLFSNISVFNPDEEFTKEILDQVPCSKETKSDFVFLGIFGTLYPNADLETTIRTQALEAKNKRKQLVFLSVGKIGRMDEFNRLKDLFIDTVKFINLGMLEDWQVSTALQLLDLSVSCTPYEHIGKSGVYACLRRHNIPVLLPFSDYIPEYDQEIIEYNKLLEDRSPEEWDVKYVTSTFLNYVSK